MFSDQDYSERDEGTSAMEMLTEQMQQLQAAIASMQQTSLAPAPTKKPHFEELLWPSLVTTINGYLQPQFRVGLPLTIPILAMGAA